MMFEFHQDWDTLMLTPMVWLEAVRCEEADCGELHGYALHIGWIFWSMSIIWEVQP